jgi:nitrite reductase (NADH) small subunit
VSRGACVARLLDGSIVGFARRCPHQGADLSLGTIGKDTITCPYHNLHFDLETGASACRALQRLRRYPVTVDGDRVTVRLDERVSDD